MKKIPVIEAISSAGQKIIARIKSKRTRRNDAAARVVAKIVDIVQQQGDRALFECIRKYDGVSLTHKTFKVSQKYLAAQADKVDAKLAATMTQAIKRIKAYHLKQRETGYSMVTAEGRLESLVRPLRRVAVYVPGGHAVYPSSVLMNVVPALIAGVKEIVAVTPPRDELDPSIAWALRDLGVAEIYRMGGAHAIAALAYGTKTVKRVDKIVGPGSLYVALAKKMVFGAVDIDMIAGPSEVAILADTSANPAWVALDLLAQAEHGSGDEVAIAVVENKRLALQIASALEREIEISPRRAVLKKLPSDAISILVAGSRRQSIELINDIAPEHLQIMTHKPRKDLALVENAGAVFLGHQTPVALGDYFVGTNHVLPTGGAARFASSLCVGDFCKRISVAEVSPKGLSGCAKDVSRFARAEGFIHHALSVERRALNK